MEFINDVPNIHKDPVGLRLYRTWQHIKTKVSVNNKKYQAGITICSDWHLLSNFIDDFTKLEHYDKFVKNPTLYRLSLKDGHHHYSLNNVYLKELFNKPFPEAYDVSREEYNQVYNHYQIIYIKYKTYISLTDYNEIVNYAIGRATVSFDKNKKVLFTTFANKVVKNHIIDYIRDNKKHMNNYHLSHVVYTDDKDTILMDVLEDYNDTLKLNKTYMKIREFNNTLDTLESNILKGLVLGYSQKELSTLLKIPPIKVSRIANKLRAKIKLYL